MTNPNTNNHNPDKSTKSPERGAISIRQALAIAGAGVASAVALVTISERMGDTHEAYEPQPGDELNSFVVGDGEALETALESHGLVDEDTHSQSLRFDIERAMEEFLAENPDRIYAPVVYALDPETLDAHFVGVGEEEDFAPESEG